MRSNIEISLINTKLSWLQEVIKNRKRFLSQKRLKTLIRVVFETAGLWPFRLRNHMPLSQHGVPWATLPFNFTTIFYVWTKLFAIKHLWNHEKSFSILLRSVLLQIPKQDWKRCLLKYTLKKLFGALCYLLQISIQRRCALCYLTSKFRVWWFKHL